MEEENATGYRLSIIYFCTALRRGRVLDYRSKGPRFDPRPGHGDFFKSP